MEKITVLCVGKLKEPFYREAAAEYAKRLSRYCRLEIVELPEQRLPENPSPGEIANALAREVAAIREKLAPGTCLVALCIEGQTCSSEAFSRLLSGRERQGEKRLVFLLGGSCGLDPALKGEARFKLSMSPMTFPHHLARVMLLEQLYRGFTILEGGKYHK